MVFDPTFHEIDREAAGLPDLTGAGADLDPDDTDGALDPADPDSLDEDQEGVAEGDAESQIVAGNVPADELPPYGEE